MSQFWKHYSRFNALNTLIVDDSAYKCFKNLRHCCLIIPKLEDVKMSEIAEFLNGKILNWLWHWLLAEDRPQYAWTNRMHTAFDKGELESVSLGKSQVTNTYFKLLRPFRRLL